MVVVLVEPAGALLIRSLELRGNTLEPYSCEVLASYSGEMLACMGCKVKVHCCADDVPHDSSGGAKRLEPKKYGPSEYKVTNDKGEIDIHVLQHGRKSVEDMELATEINNLLKSGTPPYIVGLSVRTYAYTKSLALSAILKSWNPKATIVLGGYHPSVAHGEKTKDYWKTNDEHKYLQAIDYLTVGEGEKPLTALLATRLGIDKDKIKETLKLQFPASELDRLASADRKPKELPAVLGGDAWRMSDKEFELAPCPVRNPFLIANWCRNWNLAYPSPVRQTGVFQIQFTRGCSHSACKFCCTPHVFGKTADVRHKNPEKVVEEIIAVREAAIKYSLPAPNFAYFNDVTFNSTDSKAPNWRDLCKKMILGKVHTPHAVADLHWNGATDTALNQWLNDTTKALEADTNRKLDIPTDEDLLNNLHWFALCRGDAISLEDAVLMASAGCSKVGVGVESFSDDVAGSSGINKHNPSTRNSYTDRITIALENTDRVGIINRIYLILGSPTETIESLKATWVMLTTLPVDQIRVAFYVPYVTGDDLLENDRTLLTEDAPNIKTPQLAPEIVRMLSEACNKRKSEEQANRSNQKTDFDDPLDGAIHDASCDSEGLTDDKKTTAFLKAYRDLMIRLFYTSQFYKERVLEKLDRYPHLEQSYREFFMELLETSAGKIDIRAILEIRKTGKEK